MAMLMSFVALSIDAMMPALGLIGIELQVGHPNDVQFVISSIFIGMGLGLMFFGPFSDSFGRKKAIYLGLSIYLAGTIACIFASNFTILIGGRILQGLGAASCRVSTMSIIRDRYEGNTMARIMSLIMILFILVPALAPSIGQIILQFAGWRVIFMLMLLMAITSLVWLSLGLEETLTKDKRLAFSLDTILKGVKETLRTRSTMSYTIASALIFGAFIGYLSSSQQLLQEQYGLQEMFSVVFGVLALSVGLAGLLKKSFAIIFM